MFDNLYKPIYIATKKDVEVDDYNNEIVVYNEPFFYGNANYQPLSGNDLMAYMSVYGETKNKLVRVFIDSYNRNAFKEYDLAYLYGATPENEKIYGEFANYRVRTFAEQNTKIMVVFEEMIKEKVTYESENQEQEE